VLHRPQSDERPRSSATKPVESISQATSAWNRDRLMDPNRTSSASVAEKSCIQAIGILLIDFTNAARATLRRSISPSAALQRGNRSRHAGRRADVGYVNVGVTFRRRVGGPPASVIPERLRAFRTIRGEDNHIAFSGSSCLDLCDGGRTRQIAESPANASGPRELDRTTSWPDGSRDDRWYVRPCDQGADER